MNSSFNTPFDQVGDFHEVILGEQSPEFPVALSLSEQQHRIGFLGEELDELQDAFHAGDLVGAADALADLIYVAYGTAYLMGLPFDEIWNAVHEANMLKICGRTKRGFDNDAVKPEGWRDPKLVIRELLKC